MQINRGRSSHRTQWAAQFAVASELIKRGYEVALTMGNHPEVDLMAISPGKTQFVVDVKGLQKQNSWVLKKRRSTQNLFYILALVPKGEPNKFFILTQDEAIKGVELDLEGWKARKVAKHGSCDETKYVQGFQFKYGVQFKDAWGKLPQ